jgi:hypothetical protein
MKKLFLILSAATWVVSAPVTVAQQKATPAKPAASPASPPASTSSPSPEKTNTEQSASERLEKFAGTIERIDEVGKEMPFSDLKREMGVAVDYRMEGDRKTAVSIRVAAPKAVPREKTP